MYVRLAGRVRVNTASLNAQGTVGNVIELARAHILLRTEKGYELMEVPVVTGNSLKHWHFVHFVSMYTELDGKNLCEYCKRLIGYRSPDRDGKDEEYFVRKCAGEDVHGFLQPENNVRRESLVKISFLLPVEDLETRFDTITHNRVVVSERGTIERGERGMMLFKRQYASAVYGFSMVLDLEYVGRLLYDPSHRAVVDDEEIRRRSKAALLALVPLLAGEIGASRSRAQPAWKVEELIAAWSQKPIPPLTHGHYKDYVEQSIRTLATYAKLSGVSAQVITYGLSKDTLSEVKKIVEETKVEDKLTLLTLIEKGSWQDVISHIVNLVEKYLPKKPEEATEKPKATEAEKSEKTNIRTKRR